MAAGDPGSPARYYSSTAVETALSGSIPSQSQGQANTAFIVASVSGFPASYPYTLIVDPDTSKEEVVTVYAGSGTTLSVYRGSDNTQAVAHSAGAVVRHGVSGREFRESENHIAARGFDIDQTILDAANQTHVHGIATGDGVIVGTLKAQTLTQKTLTTPTINGATLSGAVTSTATVTGGTFTSVTVTSSTISTSTFTGSFTASAATFVSPTISGSPVITGLSSAGMVDTSATPKNYVDAILGSATAAATSAASAAASATAAATSATSAAASASAAASSASASATSASAAATSAASAATSATAAATSATSAAASATAAATSATSAAASATTAAASVATIAGYATASANSASAAATSATSAAASESAAAASAASAAASTSAAAASAAAAATSATSASASATAAATSATSAAASATAAATSATSASNSASASATSASAAATSAASAATSATSAASSATSAEAAWDQFDDRYLGAKTSDPTVDNDGNALVTGALYFNSVVGAMKVYDGAAWDLVAPDTSNFIDKSILAAKGDLISASTASTPSVLTAASTNGYILSINSATTTGLEWVAANPGDITGVTAGDGLTGGGTSGAVTLAVSSDVLRTSGGQVISANTSSTALEIRQIGAGNAFVVEDNTNPDASSFTIDTNGLVWVGGTTDLPGIPELNMILSTETASGHSLVIRKSNDGVNSSNMSLAKSRGTIASPTIVQSGDNIGGYVFHAYDGTNYLQVAAVSANVDGTPGTSDMPTRLSFQTTPDGGTSHTERMRIDSAGNVFIGTPVTAGQNTGGLTIQGKDIELMNIMGAY